MQTAEGLKKQLRAVDLCLAAGRKRQSARTGFVHLFAGDEAVSDTIPVYENFCFALALFRQKTGEAVLEGKERIERLLAFQDPHGNFPIYLHDFPRCWDPLMPLKIAPVLILLSSEFDSILGCELKEKIKQSLQKLLVCAEARRSEKPYAPIWENRYLACSGQPLNEIDAMRFSAQDWHEWIVTAQIADWKGDFPIPYNTELEAFLGKGSIELQEKGEPKPCLVEWIAAESTTGISSRRLLRDHPEQLYLAPLFPIELTHPSAADCEMHASEGNFRLLWKGASSLHSLAACNASRISIEENRAELYFDLSDEMKIGRDDLFEASLFTDFSPDTEVFIEGKKGTLFRLGEKISIQTPSLKVELRFDLLSGEGDFCGHHFRGNRPSQTACKGANLYEAYDWQIGLRTLRRSAPCTLRIIIVLN